MAADHDNNKDITQDELITECSKIHCAYVLKKLRSAIENAKGQTVDSVFHTLDNNGDNQMSVTEFNEMISMLYQTVDKYEVDTLFKHFDKKGRGRITLQEFKDALYKQLSLQNDLQISLHDLLTPLKTVLKRNNLRPEGVFEKFSKDKKYISINDLK